MVREGGLSGAGSQPPNPTRWLKLVPARERGTFIRLGDPHGKFLCDDEL